MAGQVYSNCSSITPGCYLYSDACSSIPVANGYYSNGTDYYVVTGGAGQVTTTGPCSGYSVNVYAQVGGTVGASCAVYYKIGINGVETFLATVTSAETTCQFQGTIGGLANGDVLYIGFRAAGGSGYIQYNAQEANNVCPSNLATYCGLDYNRTITSDLNLSLTAYVSAGSYSFCTPIYTSPSPTPSTSISKTPSITPTRTPSITTTATPGASPTRTPTRTPSVTASISITPTRTPSRTPSVSVSPAAAISPTPTKTPTPTRTTTPTPTPSPTLYSINIYAKIDAAFSVTPALWTSTDNVNWVRRGSAIGLSCSLKYSANVLDGTTIYYAISDNVDGPSVTGTYYHGANTTTTCPTVAGSTCIGSVIVTANTTRALTSTEILC